LIVFRNIKSFENFSGLRRNNKKSNYFTKQEYYIYLPKEQTVKKKEGFPGQLSYVIPEKIQEKLKQNPLTNDLFLTDIGYYPQARHHYRSREEGIPQSILIYNVGGYGTIEVAGKRHVLPPDHFFIIPENLPHFYYSSKEEPWSIYWIHFTGRKSRLFTVSPQQCISIERSKTSRTNDRFALLGEIFQNLERGYSIETLEYINLCLPRLLASFTHLKQFRSINDPQNKDSVSLAINFMLENLKSKLSLAQLAKVANLSPTYFSRMFLSRTGFSPIDYFIQLKIQRSCRLLENKDFSIAEAARESGFDDQFYFSRQFKKVMNISPREYRKWKTG
jgi:AraC-like DNA-binding protein